LEEVIVVGDGVEEVAEPEPLPQPGINNTRNSKPLPDNRTMCFNFVYLGVVGAGKIPHPPRIGKSTGAYEPACIYFLGWLAMISGAILL
jgi:hypothetical protein